MCQKYYTELIVEADFENVYSQALTVKFELMTTIPDFNTVGHLEKSIFYSCKMLHLRKLCPVIIYLLCVKDVYWPEWDLIFKNVLLPSQKRKNIDQDSNLYRRLNILSKQYRDFFD